jgi:hypothetical protein
MQPIAYRVSWVNPTGYRPFDEELKPVPTYWDFTTKTEAEQFKRTLPTAAVACLTNVYPSKISRRRASARRQISHATDWPIQHK